MPDTPILKLEHRYITVAINMHGKWIQPFACADTLDVAVYNDDMLPKNKETSATYDRKRNRWLYDNSNYSLFPTHWEAMKDTVKNVWCS